MGLFSAIFGVNHKDAVPKAVAYVTRLDISTVETQVVNALSLDIATFIAERNLLMAALVLDFLAVFERKIPSTQITLTRNSLSEAMDKYFSSLAGVDAATGREQLYAAYRRYPLPDLERFGESFISQVRGNSQCLAEELSMVEGLIKNYAREAAFFVRDLAENLYATERG